MKFAPGGKPAVAGHAAPPPAATVPSQAPPVPAHASPNGTKALAESRVDVVSPRGVVQTIPQTQAKHLEHLDDPDHHDPLQDVPESNLNAADAVMQTQMSKGVGKMADLKANPDIDHVAAKLELGRVEEAGGHFMDISGGASSRHSQPMMTDLSEQDHLMAAQHAASQLASGEEQEAMIAGPQFGAAPTETKKAEPTAAAPPAAAAPVAEEEPPARQVAEKEVNDTGAQLADSWGRHQENRGRLRRARRAHGAGPARIGAPGRS